MRGNSHVRFLGGRGRVTARAYPAWPRGAYWLATREPEGSLGVASGRDMKLQSSLLNMDSS